MKSVRFGRYSALGVAESRSAVSSNAGCPGRYPPSRHHGTISPSPTPLNLPALGWVRRIGQEVFTTGARATTLRTCDADLPTTNCNPWHGTTLPMDGSQAAWDSYRRPGGLSRTDALPQRTRAEPRDSASIARSITPAVRTLEASRLVRARHFTLSVRGAEAGTDALPGGGPGPDSAGLPRLSAS